MNKKKASYQQNLYAVRVDKLNERSVLLFHQCSAWTSLLNKFKYTKRCLGLTWCNKKIYRFRIPTLHSLIRYPNFK